MESPAPAITLVITVVILVTGLGSGWVYLRGSWLGPRRSGSAVHRHGTLGEHRPWRQLGAAIFLLVSIMFVLGVALVDIPDHPRAYASYWAVLLALVVWLCGLAIKDVRYTHQQLARWHKSRAMPDPAQVETDSNSKKWHG